MAHANGFRVAQHTLQILRDLVKEIQVRNATCQLLLYQWQWEAAHQWMLSLDISQFCCLAFHFSAELP